MLTRSTEMRMKDPVPQYSYLIHELKKRHPDFAYLHLIEPRVLGSEDIEVPDGETNDHFRALWDGPLITAGGYHRSLALEVTDKNPKELIAFTRYYIANVGSP